MVHMYLLYSSPTSSCWGVLFFNSSSCGMFVTFSSGSSAGKLGEALRVNTTSIATPYNYAFVLAQKPDVSSLSPLMPVQQQTIQESSCSATDLIVSNFNSQAEAKWYTIANVWSPGPTVNQEVTSVSVQ